VLKEERVKFAKTVVVSVEVVFVVEAEIIVE
jgi:hypothetical protein